MTVVESFEARLLGPLTYHSVPDAGAGGATVTLPVLGDTALSYAIHHSIHGHPIPFRFGSRGPDYRGDYRHFRSLAGVGVPIGAVQYLSPEYVASSFVSEGYEQVRISTFKHFHGGAATPKSLVDATPWRPWRRVQSLAPTEGRANLFGFSVVSARPLPDRFTVRIGLGKGCLVEARKAAAQPTCAVNRYTVETILGREWPDVPHTHRESPLAQLQIYHGVPTETAARLLALPE